MVEFVQWLGRMRDQVGSGDLLARRIGVTAGHISKILAGERVPGFNVFRGAWLAFPEERPTIRRLGMLALFGEDGGNECAD